MSTPHLEIRTPPGEATISFQRFVAAPPALVFACMTQCEHLGQWWGPAYLELTECEIDLRVGGRYRFVSSAPDGTEHPFHGEYLEIDAPHRLVSTFVYEPWPDASAVDTVELTAKDGGTLMAGTSVFGSVETRDRHVESGMEGGMRESYERLDRLVETLHAG